MKYLKLYEQFRLLLEDKRDFVNAVDRGWKFKESTSEQEFEIKEFQRTFEAPNGETNPIWDIVKQKNPDRPFSKFDVINNSNSLIEKMGLSDKFGDLINRHTDPKIQLSDEQKKVDGLDSNKQSPITTEELRSGLKELLKENQSLLEAWIDFIDFCEEVIRGGKLEQLTEERWRKLRRCGKGTEAYQGGEPDIVESVQLLDNPDERVLNTLEEYMKKKQQDIKWTYCYIALGLDKNSENERIGVLSKKGYEVLPFTKENIERCKGENSDNSNLDAIDINKLDEHKDTNGKFKQGTYRGYILIKTNPKYWEGFYKEDKSDGLFSEYLRKTSDFIQGDGKTNLCPPSIWNVGEYEIVIGGNRRLVTFACLGALPKIWVCKSL